MKWKTNKFIKPLMLCLILIASLVLINIVKNDYVPNENTSSSLSSYITNEQTSNHNYETSSRDDVFIKENNTSYVSESLSETYTTESTSSLEKTTDNKAIYYIPDWNERNITEKFNSVIFNNNTYIVASKEPTKHSVEKMIAKETVWTTDYNTGKKYKADVEVFSLERINPDCSVGVKFLNSDDVYPYINDSYEPKTLGEFKKAIDFENTILFGDTEYEISLLGMPLKKEKKVENQKINSYLFSDDSAKNIQGQNIKPIISIGISCPAIGMNNMVVNVSADGYLSTNLLRRRTIFFYIGEESVEKFVEEVLKIKINGFYEEASVTHNYENGDFSPPYFPD